MSIQVYPVIERQLRTSESDHLATSSLRGQFAPTIDSRTWSEKRRDTLLSYAKVILLVFAPPLGIPALIFGSIRVVRWVRAGFDQSAS